MGLEDRDLEVVWGTALLIHSNLPEHQGFIPNSPTLPCQAPRVEFNATILEKTREKCLRSEFWFRPNSLMGLDLGMRQPFLSQDPQN